MFKSPALRFYPTCLHLALCCPALSSFLLNPPTPACDDAGWGRNLECPGEDPLVSGQYAAAFVGGLQTAREVPYPLQASACCKHFVANELESWNGSTRHTIDARVPARDLVDSYLPPFQACVQEGGASGIMCSCEWRACGHEPGGVAWKSSP